MKRPTPRQLRLGVAIAALLTMLIPPSDPVKISFVFSNDARDLLTPIIDDFNESQNDVVVLGEQQPSGTVTEDIVAGDLEPVMWMPAASTWPRLLNHSLGRQVAPASSPSFFWSPEVIGTFEHVQADAQIDGWGDLVRMARSGELPGGQAFRLGHTKPTSSTSGLYAVTSEFGAVSSSPEPIVDANTIRAVEAVEGSVLHYGDIADDFCPLLRQYSAYVSAFYMQETTFLKCAVPGLVGIIPTETYIADYPMVILDAGWVSEREAKAAEHFAEYLAEHLTLKAVLDQEYRYGDPWDSDGTGRDPAPPGLDDSGAWRALGVPPAHVLADVQQAWLDVRKEASLLILIDTARGMSVANRLGDAKELLREYLLDDLPADVSVGLSSFDQDLGSEVPIRILSSSHRELIHDQLERIGPSNEEPALCDSLSAALDEVSDPGRIDIILLLSRGDDVGSHIPCEVVRERIRKLATTASPVQIYVISFGDPRQDERLEAIAIDSLGWCADRTREGHEVDLCEIWTTDKLLDAVRRIV